MNGKGKSINTNKKLKRKKKLKTENRISGDLYI